MGGDGNAAQRGGTPTPTGWSGRRVPVRTVLGMVFFVVAALCGLGVVVAALPARDWEIVAVGAVMALLFGSTFGFLVVAWSRGSGAAPTSAPWPGGGGSGVRFGYSTSAYCWFSAMLAGCVLVFGGLAVVQGTSGGTVGRVAAVVLGGLAALIGWFLVTMLRHAPGELVLSPVGVAHRMLTGFYSVPWSAVFEVEARRLGTPVIVVKAYPAPESVLRRHTGRFDTGELRFLPFLVVRTYWLAADAETVLRALTFYHAHPELRDELATPAGPARIAAGRTGA